MYRRDIYIPIEKPIRKFIDPQYSNRILKNVTDDFKLQYKFVKKSDHEVIITPDQYNLRIKYYIKGCEGEYYVEKIGTTLINCVVAFDQSIIKAILSDHKLPTGHLLADLTFMTYDHEFPNRISRTTKTIDTKITLVDDGMGLINPDESQSIITISEFDL